MGVAHLAQSPAGVIAAKVAILLFLLLMLSLVVVIPMMVVRTMRRAKVPGTYGNTTMDPGRLGCYERAGRRLEAWQRAHPQLGLGPEVEIVFHTISGVLVYSVEWEHRERLPSVAAGILLGELHRFNLRHGMFSHGALFVPLISYYNYRKQLANIRRAEVGAGFVV